MSLVTDKARELGEALQADPAYAALTEAKVLFDADAALQADIEKFNTMQNNFAQLQSEESEDQEKLNNLAQTMVEFRNQIMENDNMQLYGKAKEAFDGVIKGINAILYFYMTGEEEESCSPDQCESCGGGCGGSCH